MTGIKIVFGGGAINADRAFGSKQGYEQLAKALKQGGCNTIDTATLYGDSEKLLSEFGAPKEFTIDTKTVGGFAKQGDKSFVIAQGEQSQKLLGNVDIWYIHSPDYNIPIENTLEGINELHKRGFFKRFGLSNYKAEDVQKVYDACKAKGYPLPTAYQGNYNAVARLGEDDLFPVLRKLGMSFYAYSPIAGGFLTKSKQDIADGKGRFDPSNFLGEMYHGMYARPTLLEALDEWASIADAEGIPRAELAYRWINHHSVLSEKYGDGIIFGASSQEQAEQTLRSLQAGPLSENAAKRINAIWEKIKHEAPRDNLHR